MTRLRLREDRVHWRRTGGGEIVALDVEGSVYFAINRSGTMLWPTLVDGATREELIAALRDGYGIDPGQAARDVDAFIASLQERGLLGTAS